MRIKSRVTKLMAGLMATMTVVFMLPAATAGAVPVLPPVTLPPQERILTAGPVWPGSVPPGFTTATAGFPAWYQDSVGQRAELYPNPNAIDNLISPPDPLEPQSPPNYDAILGWGGGESFYWNASEVFTYGGVTNVVVFGVEAAFATANPAGAPFAGQEAPFARIRWQSRQPLMPAGTYTFQHPWGQDTITIPAVGRIFFSDDVGGVVGRDFATPGTSRLNTFLKSTTAPPGKFGDGITESTVTGGPVRNNVIITGPAGTITLNNFVVAGRIAASVAPVASFTATPLTGAQPLSVTFTDTSTNFPSTWAWSFGDGTTSTVQSPTHIFSAAGTFTVTESVTNAAGTSIATRTITVTAGTPAIPVAAFDMLPPTGNSPLAVSFHDVSSGIPTSWTWNFGDGTPTVTATSTAAVPNPPNQNPTHTYRIAPTAAPTTFTVTLVVSNALGNAATSKLITVSPEPPAVPVAGFTATPPAGVPPLTVKFTDTTTGVPSSWSWSFGDGSPVVTATSTAAVPNPPNQNPTHTFTTAGLFPVVLTATNALGTSLSTQVVNVGNVPPTPTGLTGTAISSTQVNLAWTSTATNATLVMIQRSTVNTFPVASTSELHAPAATDTTFSDIGVTASSTFFYRVIIANQFGNSLPSNVVSVTTPAVGAPVPPGAPASSFTMNVSTGTAPLTVNFTDTSTNTPTGWSWNFGDGTAVATTQNPSHVFSSAGTFTVTLTARNATGAGTVATQTVTVNTPGAPIVPVVVAPPPPPVFFGGGGGGFSAPPPVRIFAPVTLKGLVTSTGLNNDAGGKVQQDAQIKTLKDEVVLDLAADTKMADKDGAKLTSVSATAKANPSPAPAGAVIISDMDLGPDGAQFVPAISLAMTFDKAKLPAGVAANKLYIAYFDGKAWVKMDSVVNETSSTVSTLTTHFTEFAIVADAAAPAGPTGVAAPSPAAPTGLKASVSGGVVSLSWDLDPTNNEVGFMIERANDANFSVGEAEFHTMSNVSDFTDVTVSPGKTYFYKIEAVGREAHSAASNVVSVTTPGTAAPPPTTAAPATTPPAATTVPPTTPAKTTAPPPTTAKATEQATSNGSATGWIIGGIIALALVAVLAMVVRGRKK